MKDLKEKLNDLMGKQLYLKIGSDEWIKLRIEMRKIEKEIQKIEYADKINETYIDDKGAYRWKASDNVPPIEFLEAWGLDEETMKRCQEANDKSLSDICKRMKNYVPSAEEKYEMQAAFGKGATVVNIITGKKYTV